MRMRPRADIRTFMVNRSARWCVGFAAAVVATVVLPACQSSGLLAEQHKINDALRHDVARLERALEKRDGSIAGMKQQIDTLKAFDADRPVDLFAPVKVEIVSRSGGYDYDGKPGDDGVKVHLRPIDADGDAVKVPGRIKIQLLDMSNLGSPKVLGFCEFDDPDKLRQAWHSRFGTQHYTLKCPFSAGAEIPASRKVTVHAEFVGFLTGAPLTAVKEVGVSFPNP